MHVGSLMPLAPPTSVGNYVSVAHGAVLQGCTVQDSCLIGMNAILQAGVTVRHGGGWGSCGVYAGMVCHAQQCTLRFRC